MLKAGIHKLISKNNRVFKTNISVALVNDLRDRLLNHRLVDHFKRQARRNYFPKQGTTNGGINNFLF